MEFELPNQILNSHSTAVQNGEDDTESAKKGVLKIIPSKEFDEISLSSIESEESDEIPPEFPDPCVTEDSYSPGTSPQIKIDTKTLGNIILAPPQTGNGQSPRYSVPADMRYPTTETGVPTEFLQPAGHENETSILPQQSKCQCTHASTSSGHPQIIPYQPIINININGNSPESVNATELPTMVEQILKNLKFTPPVPQCPAAKAEDLQEIVTGSGRGGGDIFQDVNTLNINFKTMPASTAAEIWATMGSRYKRQMIWFFIASLIIIAALLIYLVVVALKKE